MCRESQQFQQPPREALLLVCQWMDYTLGGNVSQQHHTCSAAVLMSSLCYILGSESWVLNQVCHVPNLKHHLWINLLSLASLIPVWHDPAVPMCDSDCFYSLLLLVKVKVAQSCRLFVTLWTLLSMEFSKPEYWSEQPFPSPGDLPNPGIKPGSLHCRQILYQLSYEGSPPFALMGLFYQFVGILQILTSDLILPGPNPFYSALQGIWVAGLGLLFEPVAIH